MKFARITLFAAFTASATADLNLLGGLIDKKTSEIGDLLGAKETLIGGLLGEKETLIAGLIGEKKTFLSVILSPVTEIFDIKCKLLGILCQTQTITTGYTTCTLDQWGHTTKPYISYCPPTQTHQIIECTDTYGHTSYSTNTNWCSTTTTPPLPPPITSTTTTPPPPPPVTSTTTTELITSYTTVTALTTTTLTVTSCGNNGCVYTKHTTGVTVVTTTKEATVSVYTTYCPLTYVKPVYWQGGKWWYKRDITETIESNSTLSTSASIEISPDVVNYDGGASGTSIPFAIAVSTIFALVVSLL
ncbi:uncharacterized protein RJT20DRAFT_124544 [Scheffersomyces xylosifermentans]|uniref:uncharacterized protein n=1 Tax=Scheffersomyces xylosifermentans TaxID=1304137 RepID=UPI00315DE3A3